MKLFCGYWRMHFCAIDISSARDLKRSEDPPPQKKIQKKKPERKKQEEEEKKRKKIGVKVQKRWRRIEGPAPGFVRHAGDADVRCLVPGQRGVHALSSVTRVLPPPRGQRCSFNRQTHRQTCIGTSSSPAPWRSDHPEMVQLPSGCAWSEPNLKSIFFF